MNLVPYISEILMSCVLNCVFGAKLSELGEIGFKSNGEVKMMHAGMFLRYNMRDNI